MKEKVNRYFHGPEGYNCAQAILKIFQEHKGILEETIDEFSAHGGGRAPEGLCGALHAVLYMTDDSLHEAIKTAFSEKAGSLQCRKIRRKKSLTCHECVELAADLIKDKEKI